MQRGVAVLEQAAAATCADSLDLGDDGQRDLFGRLRADIQARRTVQAAQGCFAQRRVILAEFGGEFGQETVGAASGPEHADVGGR